MAKSVKPTGCSIARNVYTFTFSWKIGDKNYGDGQQLQYRVNRGSWSGWTNIAVGKTATSASVTLSGTVKAVGFQVRGNRKSYTKSGKRVNPGYSDWAGATYNVGIPAAPTDLKFEVDSANSGTFTWRAESSATDPAFFLRTEYQTCWRRDNAVNAEAFGGVTVTSGTQSTAGSVTITEETEHITAGALVRWIRVRSVGPAGASAWVYEHHAYSTPSTPQLEEAHAEGHGSYTTIEAKWRGAYALLSPIDEITVEYAIDTPDSADMSVPVGVSWDEALTVSANGGYDYVQANVSDVVGVDECMWVRIKSTHDSRDAYSNAMLAMTGALAAPTNLSVGTVETSTGTVTVSFTANSDSTVSKIALLYRSAEDPSSDKVVGIADYNASSITVTIPELMTAATFGFGVFAFIGEYSGSGTDYTISPVMRSAEVWEDGNTAKAPESLTLTAGSEENSVRVGWPWTWTAATGAEIAWADHSDAWESTSEPSYYQIENNRPSSWVVSDLTPGKVWYFRVRLTTSDTKGPWSEIYSYDLGAIPITPGLVLSQQAISADGSFEASWVFLSDDGSTQEYAEVAEYEVGDYTIIAHVTTAQTVELAPGWEENTTHSLAVRTCSTSGKVSDWSPLVAIYCIPEITAEITQTSLADGKLTAMPLTVTATGAGTTGQTSLQIVRAADYHIVRPDGRDYDGYEGEIVASYSQTGEAQMTIETADLIGRLDDGAPYKIVVTVQDEYGQSVTSELAFTVDWAHQAGVPDATIEIDEVNRIAKITPIAPENYVSGDVCDIYRLSADKPELIYEGAEFGTTYVDPYPGFGPLCGHRIVTRTADGDYITEDNQLAWLETDADSGDVLNEKKMIVNADGMMIELPYNIQLQNSWKKDFRRTSYLGGSVEGDWNPGVLRDLNAQTVLLRGRDTNTQIDIRDLSEFNGLCHVRTPDGSSFNADIEVTEDMSYESKRVSYMLRISKVDPEELEGMTLAEWENINQEEE